MKANKQGFLQALGVAIYCSLVGGFFWQAPKIFPKDSQYFAPVILLLLFSTSAMICGLIVFLKPYKLFFADKKKEAANVVVSTALWLFLFLLIFFSLMVIFK